MRFRTRRSTSSSATAAPSLRDRIFGTDVMFRPPDAAFGALRMAALPTGGVLRATLHPSGGVLRVVGDHDVGAGTPDRRQGLQHRGALVERSRRRGGLDHGVLAADVVG